MVYPPGKNPNSLANLKPQRSDQPGKNPLGKPKGSKNRATGLRNWLAYNIKFENVEIDDEGNVTGKIIDDLPENFKISIEDAIDFALISEAKNGNINAIKEIKDTLYGKIADKNETDLTVTKIEVEYIDNVNSENSENTD